ncbi:MAG: Ig-like domain-containing protein [Elusimicrobiota bacterium]|jgi:hypothetical protein
MTSNLRILTLLLCAGLSLSAHAGTGIFGNDKPNVLIMLDTSGSMADNISALPAYVPGTTYANAGYTAAQVYYRSGSEYLPYANNIAAVASAAAQTSLTNYGIWFGEVAGIPYQLYVGNYINYTLCTACKTSQTKISIAQRIINRMLNLIPNARFGVARFINNNTLGSGGAGITANTAIGASVANITAAVTAMVPSGYTPLGETVRDEGLYFQGQLGALPTPVQSACQLNSTILITDGLQNGNLDVRTQATNMFTLDHSTHTGVQNIVVHTVGFSLVASERLQALAVLQQTAINGGGVFFQADDSAQLEQALFALPPIVNVTAPTAGAIVSGHNVALSATLPNNSCVAGLRFRVDGSTVGIELTAAPFSINWDSTLVANGTHTVIAVARDAFGNYSTSSAVGFNTNNDLTPPAILSSSFDAGLTSATINWTTNEASDSQVEYGTSTSLGMTTTLDSSLLTAHTVVLTGLTPGTNYYYKLKSQDAAGNLGTYTGGPSATGVPATAATHEGFSIKFINNGALQTGPGFTSSNRPYALYVGDCYPAIIEAIGAGGLHYNYNGDVTMSQYFISSLGAETSLAEGIALSNDSRLGQSSMTLAMVNGYLFLGSETDFSRRLCFYRSTRSPGDAKTSGALGDMIIKAIKTGDSTKNGQSASYVGWHGDPNHLKLLPPVQELAPATVAGSSGAVIAQQQGLPFRVNAYLADLYGNAVLNYSHTLRFKSSSVANAAFYPIEGAVINGVISSSVTLNDCATSITLTAEDVTAPGVTSADAAITLGACGVTTGTGFYDTDVPAAASAVGEFAMTITVKNVDVPVGAGSVQYSANLIPLVPTDATHFALATSTLSITHVEFSIPEGTVGDFVYTIPNQKYQKAETIWIQLIGTAFPPELAGASSLTGPLAIDAGPAARLLASASPSRIGPNSVGTITATVTDIVGNGKASVDLTAQSTLGSGRIYSGNIPVLQAQAATNAAGQVPFSFLSGRISENNKVLVSAAPALNLTPVEVTILTSLLGDERVAAYPSPVKITERPLTIEYRLDVDSDVRVRITDLFGRLVWQTSYSAGSAGGQTGFNTITWDGRNGAGQTVAVGVYALHLEMSGSGQTAKASTRFGIKK